MVSCRRQHVASFLLVSQFFSVTSQYYNRKVGESTEIFIDVSYGAEHSASCITPAYFSLWYPYPCQDLLIQLKVAKGNPSIYVSKSIPYPKKGDLTWTSNKDNLYSFDISQNDPGSYGGYFYIGVYDDCTQQNQESLFQIQAFKKQDRQVYMFNTDIVKFPALSRNKILEPNAYMFYSFCVPRCSNVAIAVKILPRAACTPASSNCQDSRLFPQLFISRQPLFSYQTNYSYKTDLGMNKRTWLNHSDPSSRNSNGYIQGIYYVAVYGRCTPPQYVQNSTAGGQCAFAKSTYFNVTVTMSPVAGSSAIGECPEETRAVILPVAPSYPSIQTGAPVAASVPCGTYTYYSLAAPSPCAGAHVTLNTIGGSILNTAKLVVGQYPNIKPTYKNIGWAGENYGPQDLTISAYDPAFRGGDRCGPDGASQCLMYIGVTGYCALPGATRVNFTLSATLVPVTTNAFQAPLTNQIVTAKGEKKYVFCVDSAANVVAQMKSFTSACKCPSSYANYAATISKSTPDATQQDLTWKMGGSGNETASVQLMASDKNTRPGVYYLTVFGNCGSASDCRGSECTCAPCANVANSPYALYVGTAADFTAGKSSAASLGTCAVAEVTGGIMGQCSASCPFTPTPITSISSSIPTISAQIGIAAACLFVTLVVLGFLFFYNYVVYTCFCPLRGGSKYHFTVLRRRPEESMFRMSENNVIEIAETESMAPSAPPQRS